MGAFQRSQIPSGANAAELHITEATASSLAGLLAGAFATALSNNGRGRAANATTGNGLWAVDVCDAVVMADDNLPDRFEAIVLPEGVKKLKYEIDTRIPNCTSFIIEREDHTLANALRAQLLRDRNVLFAAYRVPHPLEHHVVLKVQTRRSDYTPLEALCAALVALKNEIHVLEDEFANELQNWAAVRQAGAVASETAWRR